ncbi:MAG: hypothetical protein ACOYNL_08345 [Rickettsiales bacterium]
MNQGLTENKAESLQPTSADTATQRAKHALALAAPKKRTVGLWLVDTLIYPVVNNFGVFGISVAATYLTKHGWPEGEGKKIHPWLKSIGNVMRARGEKLEAGFRKYLAMSESQADMSRMVFFSFFDGTFIAPFVKLLEDRREGMAQSIDSALGTKPKDESVYDAEPKQTWRSVIEGRLLTSAIVVPTAVMLDKKGLNDKWFHNPGIETGHKIYVKHPAAAKKIASFLGKGKAPELFKTVYFEAFYTSVCTAGLYIISRTLARKHSPQEFTTPLPPDLPPIPAPILLTAQEPAMEAKPQAKITAATLQNRVAQPQQATEINA